MARSLSAATAEVLRAKAWVTIQYEHDGLRSWGEEVVSRLFALRRGEVYSL